MDANADRGVSPNGGDPATFDLVGAGCPSELPASAHWALDCSETGCGQADAMDPAGTAAHPHDGNLEQLIPPEPADPAELTTGKLPRRLHLWFALGLGLLSVLALGAQAVVARLWPAPASVAAGAAAAADGAGAEPPMLGLQRELARQKGVVPAAPALGRLPSSPAGWRRPGGGVEWALAEAAPSAAARSAGAVTPPPALDPAAPAIPPADGGEDPGLPGQLLGLPGVDMTTHDGTASFEHAKAQALVAGSRILALDHSVHASAFGEAGGSNPAADALSGHGRRLGELLQAAPALLERIPGLLAAGSQAFADAGTPPVDPLTGAAVPPVGLRSAGSAVPASAPPPLMAGSPPLQPLILEGTPIACVLLNELRSDLPGMIVAQVSEDVYDSVSAQTRLIPRGTRLVGHYDSQVAGGQQRLMASFHRLILPDGASLELPRMDAADRAGGAGLQDQVDTHFWLRFGQAFLTAGLARAAQRDGGPAYGAPPGGVLPGPDATGQILVDTARSGLQSASAIAPTLVIRRGTLFNVMVNRDLALPAVQTP